MAEPLAVSGGAEGFLDPRPDPLSDPLTGLSVLPQAPRAWPMLLSETLSL